MTADDVFIAEASPRRGRLDRRSFLARLAALTAASPLSGLTGCEAGGGGPSSGPGEPPMLDPVTRPALRWWADDIVHLVAPPVELPVAYVSMALRKVFVDHDFRDRAAWLLGAHISVSTALWRIPLPGDPEGQPVVPGDQDREFEELPMRAWDPALPPMVDDVRIVRGRSTLRVVQLDCVPVVGGDVTESGVWVSAAPFEVVVADASLARATSGERVGPAPPSTVREDFGIVGTGARHAERTCSGPGDAVQLMSWAER